MNNKWTGVAVLLLSALCFSCGPKTVIEGTMTDAPDSQVIIQQLDINHLTVLDTLRTDAAGAFRYTLKETSEPVFLYLFYGQRKVASLLVQAGDHVRVTADTLGGYAVSGSEESLRLQKVENAYNAFLRDMTQLLATDPAPDAALSRRYVTYYRDRVSYVLQNSRSLTVVPVLFQQVNDQLPVFDQPTDALLFCQVADSLAAVYPDSRYVAALRREGERRSNLLELNHKLQQAGEIGFLDIDLPGTDADRVKLSELKDRVIMLYFWATTANQKMFNRDVLLPLYEEFHGKGFEIYAVSLDVDKTAWGTTVRNQQLPWVNVCDTRGIQSPYIGLYGVSDLPMAYFLVDGEIDPSARVSDGPSLRAYLQRVLK